VDASDRGGVEWAASDRPSATRHVVARRLLEFVLQSRLRDGDPLPPEADLALRLHVSRGVLRESLSMLENQGIVSVHPGRGGGVRVRRPDIGAVARDLAIILRWEGRGIAEIVEARRMIEVACVRALCTRRDRGAVDRLRRAAAWRGHSTSDEGYRSFHHLLVAEAGNWVLLQTYEALRRALYDEILPPPGMNVDDHRVCSLAHRRIASAVAAGDPDLAEMRLSRHLDAFLRYMLRGDRDRAWRVGRAEDPASVAVQPPSQG
jgi:GntR family transcriptional repressor for pyruvate dehydrogenase complex